MVLDTTVVSGVGDPEPERASAVNARLDVLNAAGGINGYKIVLDACDEKGDPNVASDCARKFVSDKDVASVSDLSIFGQKYNPILLAAGIPRIGPSLQAQPNSPRRTTIRSVAASSPCMRARSSTPPQTGQRVSTTWAPRPRDRHAARDPEACCREGGPNLGGRCKHSQWRAGPLLIHHRRLEVEG